MSILDFKKIIEKLIGTSYTELDCVTFVEKVLALFLTQNNKLDYKYNLNKIRYKNGIEKFENKNHFMSLDWIPNNKWLLKDVTKYLNLDTKLAIAVIDKKTWFKQNHNIDIDLKPEKASLDYIELSNIIDNLKILPDFCIINIVRPNWNLIDKIGTNLNVSHLGFGIRESNEYYFIHSSSDKEIYKVTKIKLKNYLIKQKDIPSIGGVNILEVI